MRKLRKRRRRSTGRTRPPWSSTRACWRFVRNPPAPQRPPNKDNCMNTKFLTSMGLAFAITGCASSPTPNAALDSARTIVHSTEADPNVSKYAALDLETARKDLAVAEAASLKHDDAAIAQPAYMAAQTARLAELKATAKADDARVAAGQSERDSIVLAARTGQVDSANRAADAAKMARDQSTENAARLQAELDALKAKPTDRGM